MRRVERRRDQVGRQPVVEVLPVVQLHLLDRRVADGLQRPALDLALAQDRVDHLADVVDGDHVTDVTSPVSRSTSTLATAAAQPKAG